VDENDFDLKALVVEEDNEFSGYALRPGTALMIPDIVVPVAAVATATEDRVDLSISADDVRNLPPYLTFRRRALSLGQQLQVTLGGSSTGVGLEETAAKPTGAIEIDEGENVMLGHAGHKLGTVKEVLFDGVDLVGIVLQPEGWFKHPVILPRRFFERSDDLALFVHLTEDDLRELEPFTPRG